MAEGADAKACSVGILCGSGKKLLVRQVSDPQRGARHLVVLSWDASYGGVDVFPPIHPVQLPQDLTNGGGCADTTFMCPYLCRRVIDVRVDVSQGHHHWEEDQELHC